MSDMLTQDELTAVIRNLGQDLGSVVRLYAHDRALRDENDRLRTMLMRLLPFIMGKDLYEEAKRVLEWDKIP